jgi:transposase-like protein
MISNLPSDEFRRDAVRIALTGGLTRRQVSVDLRVEFSTLNKWTRPLATMQLLLVPSKIWHVAPVTWKRS